MQRKREYVLKRNKQELPQKLKHLLKLNLKNNKKSKEYKNLKRNKQDFKN